MANEKRVCFDFDVTFSNGGGILCGLGIYSSDSINIDDTTSGASGTLGAALPPDDFKFCAAPPKITGIGTFPVRAHAIIG